MTLTLARVGWLKNDWREATAVDAAVQTAHALAPQVVEDSCLTVEADAQAEATRRQTLKGVKRDRLEITIGLDDETDELDLGDVLTLTHSRYGLSAGKQFLILGVQPNAQEHTLTLTLWG